MENDFRTPPDRQFPQDPSNLPPERPQGSGSGVLIPVGIIAAIALVAFFSFGGNRTAEMADDPAAAPLAYDATAPSDIEPAEGDSFTEAPPAPVTTDSAAVVTTSPVEPVATLNSYASEDECATSTGKPCHYVTCDSIPEGKQPDEVCGPNFTKGWQPIVPAPDKTAIPEEVAPPLTGQGEAPVEKPPLTGQ